MKSLRSYFGWGGKPKQKPTNEYQDPTEYYEYQEPFQSKIVLIVPRYYRLKDKYKSENISVIHEGPGIYEVYPKIVDLYENTYDKIWWVVLSSDNYDITKKVLETKTKSKIYQGESGLDIAINQLYNN